MSGTWVVWALITLYVLVFGAVVVMRHAHFETQVWDLGIFAHSFWNATQGRGLINTVEQVPNHLGVHFSPFLFLLVPGYAFFQALSEQAGPYYLLIMQTLALALGAWPLFLLAKRILAEQQNTALWALAIVTAYLLYPSLHWMNLFDFHEATFFVPVLLGALYFLEAKKWIWAGVFLAAAAAVKEDMVLGVLFAGLFVLAQVTAQESTTADLPVWRRTGVQAGIIVVASALVYFLLVVKVFMPAAGGELFRIDRYANLGETPLVMVTNAIKHPLLIPETVFTPQKARYVFWLLLPLLFLPLLSWRPVLLLIPGLAENLLTNYPFQFSSLYHYDAILIPGIFLAAIYGIKSALTRWPNKEKYLGVALLLAALIGFMFRSPLNPWSFPVSYFKTTPRETAYRNMLRLVPPQVSVAAHTNFIPHLTDRREVYFAGFEQKRVDIVLLDAGDPFGFGSEKALANYVEDYQHSGEYNSYIFSNRYVVLLNKKLGMLRESQ